MPAIFCISFELPNLHCFVGLPGSGTLPRSHPVLHKWYEKVQNMMDDLIVWLGKKNKHYQTGFPLAAKLMCITLQQNDYEVARFQSFVERLHKLMRDTIFSEAVRSLGIRMNNWNSL